MAQIKDIEQEEMLKKKKEQEDAIKVKREFDWRKVPAVVMIGIVIVLFIKYQSIVGANGNMKELYLWMIIAAVIVFYLGLMGAEKNTGILTPEEAERALRIELNRKIREGQLSRWARIYIGPNNGLFFHEGMPQHYQIELEIQDNDSKDYKRAVVFAVGQERGIVTIQDHPGKVTGREPIPQVSIIPRWLKDSKKYDLDLDRVIFGGKR